jgi:hypothetical protein
MGSRSKSAIVYNFPVSQDSYSSTKMKTSRLVSVLAWKLTLQSLEIVKGTSWSAKEKTGAKVLKVQLLQILVAVVFNYWIDVTLQRYHVVNPFRKRSDWRDLLVSRNPLRIRDGHDQGRLPLLTLAIQTLHSYRLDHTSFSYQRQKGKPSPR